MTKMINMEYIDRIIGNQKEFFETHTTKELDFRKKNLKKLYKAVRSSEDKIAAALSKDFGKFQFESYTSEIGCVLNEIQKMLANLGRWSAPTKVKSFLLDFPSVSRIYPEPYGQVLIIAPWNYPLQLTLVPLTGALAAGNTAIVKPSELAPSLSSLLVNIIGDNFPDKYIACIEGGVEETTYLLSQRNDYIFFSGSQKVGKIVMKAAAEHLVPVTLELGGKNPCIVDDLVPLKTVAKRIIWGKFSNAGQTCVAPDYLLVHHKISGDLKEALKKTIIKFYGEDAYQSHDFPRIINKVHFKRIMSLIEPDKIFYGGHRIEEELYTAPTILHNVYLSDPVMQEEIFGPVLPLIEFHSLEEAVKIISFNPNPLSFYVFTRNKYTRERLIREIPAGNGNINDTVMQFVNKNLPFGGLKNSGIGRYHGKSSFDCFSNMKSINIKSLVIDPPLRYPPYTTGKLKLIKKLLH